jgi:squalene-hopene/tetraprenyl-beta-curcumene cyclase
MRNSLARKFLAVLIGFGFLFSSRSSFADESGTPKTDEALPTKIDSPAYHKAVNRGIEFLLTKCQADDGSYESATQDTFRPAVTALCTAALLRSGKSPIDPAIAKSLKYLERFVQPDGGIYKAGSAIQNYQTSIAIMCFSEANKDGRYKDLLAAADKYVKTIQWGADGSIDDSQINYGGAGYGRSKTRPDLSNTSFLLDALQSAGDSSSDEAVQRALVFVSRCQNLDSEYNTTEFPKKATTDDVGGFYYTPSDGGSSMAGKNGNDGLRSYGSMTYAGLKSMIFAGLAPEDKRVKAAVEWIRKHYSMSRNPGMGQSGLYYGYHTFAKALEALGEDPFVDSTGVKHAWKAELVAELAKRQQADGSWVNTDKRFNEADPNLVTAYALLALSHVKPEAK